MRRIVVTRFGTFGIGWIAAGLCALVGVHDVVIGLLVLGLGIICTVIDGLLTEGYVAKIGRRK